MLNETPQWVALYTSPRSEKRVESRLKTLGYEAYLPLQRILHQWSDRWKSVEMPLFPSYLFVKMRITDVAPVRALEGVSYIVSWHHQPAIIPDSQVEAIRRLMEAEAKVNVVNNSELKKGKNVRIIDGQFKGLEGMLISNCEDGNFSISISDLNVALIMTIEKDLLEPLKEDKKKKGIWEES